MKLLSGKPLCDWNASEYKAYIKSLFRLHTRKSSQKPPSKKKPFIAKRTKTGKLQLKVNRTPKWLSEVEMLEISRSTEIPLSEIFIKMKKDGVVISTEAEMKK